MTSSRFQFASIAGFLALLLIFLSSPTLAQDGTVLTNLENQMQAATAGWQARVMDAARSLFWILAGIEFAIAAIWLAIQAPSLDSWFAELVRRILFIGFFVFVLEQGPAFAQSIVTSLFQIGADGGSASPANVFNAGLSVASKLSQNAQFGLLEDNALAIASVFAMMVVVITFSLVAAIFVAVMVEMYVGLLAGMIMLGLGGSSYTKDFAVRYLVYAFSVGMKLMALVMIARIGSDILIGMANATTATDALLTMLTIAGISVVVFMIALYVPQIVQGVVQGVSVGSGMEVIRSSGQLAGFASTAAAATLGFGRTSTNAIGAGRDASFAATQSGQSKSAALLQGMAASLKQGSAAIGSAALDKATGAPGAWGASSMGLANAKITESRLEAKAARSKAPDQPS